MKTFDRLKHWESIYQTKDLKNLSWYEATPTTSLEFLKQFNVPVTAKIIDVGGGDSLLADHLLVMGYKDITVLDISETAIDKAKKRLGNKASLVKWIVADVASFQPKEVYDFWHDRAAFHFLTGEKEIDDYINTIKQNLKPDGILVIGTFSEEGPTKCSGIDIKQYSEVTLTTRLQKFFKKVKCIKVDHKTPLSSLQNFIFCSFKKLTYA